MISTSLFDRLPHDPDAWPRFVQLYTPLLLHMAKKVGLKAADAPDFVQEVMLHLYEKLPRFKPDPSRSRNAWLATVARNCLIDFRRRNAKGVQLVNGVEAFDVADEDWLPKFLEVNEAYYLVHRALAEIAQIYNPKSIKAFEEHKLKQRPAAQVAAELGEKESWVYVECSRVLAELRRFLCGLLEPPSSPS
jgi:RNA polymerase sigma-70 factor (ECF subfamily)